MGAICVGMVCSIMGVPPPTDVVWALGFREDGSFFTMRAPTAPLPAAQIRRVVGRANVRLFTTQELEQQVLEDHIEVEVATVGTVREVVQVAEHLLQSECALALARVVTRPPDTPSPAPLPRVCPCACVCRA